LNPDVFLLSDYRNIGYAYPWMRPPHEFYSTIPFYHFDGADITKKFSLDDGYLSVKIFGGYSFNQLPSQTRAINNQQSPTAGARLHYENSLWQAHLGYAYVTITSEPPIQDLLDEINNPLLARAWPNLRQIIPAITMRGKEFHYYGIGGAYDDGTWLSQMEAAYIASNTLWNPSQASAYFSFGRRFSMVTLYSLLGKVQSFHHDVNIPSPLIPIPSLINKQQLSQLLNTNEFNEQSISVGTRWDFHENMALKAQWSHYWLGNNIDSRLWQQSVDNITPNTINVMSVGIDFVF
jgi:hypothetical protein